MDLVEHFRAILRRRWTVLAASLVVAAVVFGYSATRAAVYQANALIGVSAGRATGDNATQQATVFLARNYAQLAGTRPVLADAAARSGLAISPTEAGRRLTASASNDVGFLTITAEGPSREAATSLATGAAEALMGAVASEKAQALREALAPVNDEIRALEAQLAELPGGPARGALEVRYDALVRAATDRRLAPTDRLALVAGARADPDPVSPQPLRNALLALLVAAVVNAELVVLIEALTDRFNDQEPDERISELTGLPVLARVPIGGDETTLEAFRTLRTNLMFMQTADRVRTVAVVSTNPDAGKTFCCIHLALSVASLEVPVVLIDADLRRPSIHARVGVERSPGLGDVLAGAELGSVLRHHPDNHHLRLLTAGAPLRDQAGMLGASQFAEMLEGLDWAGMVVVDTPASEIFADALAIASRCDATIVVVDARGSRRRPVRAVLLQLKQVGANPIGVVLNRTHAPDRSGYYGRYRESPPTASFKQ